MDYFDIRWGGWCWIVGAVRELRLWGKKQTGSPRDFVSVLLVCLISDSSRRSVVTMRKKLFVWVKVWCLSRWANWSCQCQLPIYSADGGREGGWAARGGVGWGSSSAAETGRQCDMLSDAPIVGHSEFTGGWRMQIWDLVVLFFFPLYFFIFPRGEEGEEEEVWGG